MVDSVPVKAIKPVIKHTDSGKGPMENETTKKFCGVHYKIPNLFLALEYS
jgi:hypothetical protein